jgi:hypothetical protein
MKKGNEIRKLIDIPENTLRILSNNAIENRMSVKAYMEMVLIDHSICFEDGAKSYSTAMSNVLLRSINSKKKSKGK